MEILLSPFQGMAAILSWMTGANRSMKHLTVLLFLMVVTSAAAQKPLDRGIHKRKTGGVSFLLCITTLIVLVGVVAGFIGVF